MFFSKDSKKSKGGRRNSTSNSELKELRVKARRRLVGALALVLAAFIVVPLLFDDPAPDQQRAPIVVPAAPDSLQANQTDETFNQNFNSLESDPIIDNGSSGQIIDDLDSDLGIDDIISETAKSAESEKIEKAAADADSKIKEITETAKKEIQKEVQKEPQTSKPAKTADERTDDGSVALALLEGKAPVEKPSTPAAGNDNYYLQVAAYTTEQDANTRRDSLIKSGVSNAYVVSGDSNGQTVYRLRVGPFGTKQAAQAAQTRLRALGYPNGLISAK